MGHSNLLAWLADTLRHKVTSAVCLWVWCHVCPLAVVPLAYITFYTTKTKGLPHQTEICSLMVQQWISYIVLKKVVESEKKKSKLQQSLWFLAKSFFHSKNEIIRSVENFSKSYFFTQVKYAPHQFRIFFNIMTWDYKILFGSLLRKPEITLELHG